ncbi:universal stress protein [Streptomyces sp. RB6PN25]|uniref:Universal stress protein n=1 Tax=Streptomyces humicola TaxID=2953240 RepID=A0ABT1Q4K9_9ACTN|nr:universal stress protein [Streptomyces humicola]MCQ4084819.1 universal stress protein [Streptomyces humicola]
MTVLPVTVGLDGSAESLAAAGWAARDARLREAPLRLVSAWPGQPDVAPGLEAEWHRWAEHMLRATASDLASSYPELRITVEEVRGDPVTVLLDEGERGQMVVLGSRGVGQISGFFLGSVGLELAATATQPVVLVRAETDVSRQGEVVVGLALRRPNDGLLEFAFEAAERRGAVLRAVHASRVPPIHGVAPWVVDTALDEAREDKGRRLGETLAVWRKRFSGVRVCEELASDAPSRRLVNAAAEASLVVVGRGPRRPGHGARLGPVSQAVVHHAPCPVAIVPG